MKIGLVSDTHVPSALRVLPDSLLEQLARVDHILHAGDVVSSSVIARLEEIAPVTAVAGNMDPPESSIGLRSKEILTLGGRVIGLKHGHQRSRLQNRYIGLEYDAPEFELFYQAMASQLPGTEIIVFGHFHVPVIKCWQDILFINPGAVAPSHGRSSFALLEMGERAEAQIVWLPPTGN